MSKLESILLAVDADPRVAGDKVHEYVNKIIADLTDGRSKTFFTKKRSILCCFICTSDEQLEILRYYYDSEILKEKLEKIFKMLVNRSSEVRIKQLTWDSKDYEDCRQRLKKLISLGWCIYTHNIQ
jgi:hypothetical protein